MRLAGAGDRVEKEKLVKGSQQQGTAQAVAPRCPAPVSNRGRQVAAWVGLFAAALAIGCASAKVEEIPSAALFYSKGLKLLEGQSVLGVFSSVDFPRAVAQFQEVIDNYPFSEFAPLAELQIAEVNEKMGKFEEAASFYQDFVEAHPDHPKLPFALYRLGECYVSQMRDPDRDQDATRKALSQLEFLTTRYPDSEFALKGKELLAKAQAQLALREAKIADFYYGKEQYHAAVPRYRTALAKSATYPGHCENRMKLGISLTRLGLRDQAEQVLKELRERCSERPELIEEIGAVLEKTRATRS
jgi:outer membrane protein assembly factor BamD